jgi:hypothetical protein
MVIERKKWILRCVCVLVIVATLFTFRAKFGPVPLNAGQQHYRPSTSTSPTFNRNSFQPHKGSFTSFDSAPSQFLATQSEDKKIIITNASLNTSLRPLDPLSTEVAMLDSLGGGSTPPVLLNATFAPLTPNDIRDLRTFVMFVGFGKTGHSILGSLLDAHPDIIIAHEYGFLRDFTKAFVSRPNWALLLFNKLYTNSRRTVLRGWRSQSKNVKGYTLGIDGNSWQGRFRQLKVIGDKSGAQTENTNYLDKTRCKYFVEGLNRTLGVPVKSIRVLRNPYDTIATKVLVAKGGNRGLARAKNSSQAARNSNSTKYLDKNIKSFFELAYKASRVISQCPISVHTIHLVDLIHQPRFVMKELCETVQVECHSDYLDLCEEKVFTALSKTRYLVKWSRKQIETVANMIERYPEYSRYSFECDC